MTILLVAVAGLACVVAGTFLIYAPAGLIALGVSLLLVYLALVNRPEGAR